MVRFHLSLPQLRLGLLVAAVALLIGPAVLAQTPRIPPGTRGYERVQIMKRAQRTTARQTPSRIVSPTVSAPSVVTRSQPSAVAVNVNVPSNQQVVGPTTPASVSPRMVTIQGPDGQIRRFPLATGVEVQYRSQSIVLRPGESTTIRVIPR